MKRWLVVMFAATLGAALEMPAFADTVGQKVRSGLEKTQDAAGRAGDKIEDTARDVRDGMHRHKTVVTAQQALKDKGHDPGAIDGRMGPRTRGALADYQKAEGLKVTGRLDGDTRARLGM